MYCYLCIIYKDAGQSLDRKNIKLSDVSCVAVCHSVCVLYLRAVSSKGWMVAPITNNVNAHPVFSPGLYPRLECFPDGTQNIWEIWQTLSCSVTCDVLLGRSDTSFENMGFTAQLPAVLLSPQSKLIQISLLLVHFASIQIRITIIL